MLGSRLVSSPTHRKEKINRGEEVIKETEEQLPQTEI